MDDLTKIKGIGPATVKKLADAGIDSYAALATIYPADQAITAISGSDATTMEWIAGAKALLPGDAPAPGTTGAEKLSPDTASHVITETADPSIGPAGEPRSAEVRPETTPLTTNGVLSAAAFEPMAAALEPNYAGTLPAKTRVMAGGRQVQLSQAPDDTVTRTFTAAIRILRNKALYEPGAPIELNRSEFATKSRLKAIVERRFEDGAAVGDD